MGKWRVKGAVQLRRTEVLSGKAERDPTASGTPAGKKN